MRTRSYEWVGIALACGLILFGLLDLVADTLSGGASESSLRWATRLASGNAAYHSQLGRYLQVTNGDLRLALGEYQKATQLNPQDASAWFDIARVEQVLGDSGEQGRSLEQAVRAAPRKPDVAWEAANFFLLRGERDAAMREFRVVVENDPIVAPAALELIWRVNPDAQELIDKVLPANVSTYSEFLSLMVTKKDDASAAKAWTALVSLQQPIPQRTALGYVDYLLSLRKADEARDAWQAMAPLCRLTSYLTGPSVPGINQIVNPRFEEDVLNAGFDWHYYEQGSVKITLDSSPQGGSHGIMISFLGPGFSETGLFQQVSVSPNTQYQFSVHFKTDELEGAGGPAFVVRDEMTGAVYLTTETLRNPGSWREVAGHFETGADAKLISVRMVRIPAGNAMRGHLWMDEVQLTRLEL